jgi:hypothetical protein
MIAFGFMSDPDSYMRSGWNVLDFFVVFVSIASDYAGASLALSRFALVGFFSAPHRQLECL